MKRRTLYCCTNNIVLPCFHSATNFLHFTTNLLFTGDNPLNSNIHSNNLQVQPTQSRSPNCQAHTHTHHNPAHAHTYMQSQFATPMLHITLLNNVKPTSMAHHPEIHQPKHIRITLPHHAPLQQNKTEHQQSHVYSMRAKPYAPQQTKHAFEAAVAASRPELHKLLHGRTTNSLHINYIII